ncbi:MAG: hypothetical protein ACYCPQ_06660 [Elusimicrobiota bacterium]
MSYVPYEQRSMLGVLRICAALLGGACLVTCFLEGWSAGAWRSYSGIYQTYYLVLGAYAGAREAEKWARPRTRADTFWGEFFVFAWCGLAFLLWIFTVLNWSTSWPPELNTVLEWVLGIYAGSKVSGVLRSQKDWPIPDPGPTPVPGGGSGPGAPSAADLVRQACQAAGTFTAEQIAQAANLTLPVARGHIGSLVSQGLVVKVGTDSYRWADTTTGGPPPPPPPPATGGRGGGGGVAGG